MFNPWFSAVNLVQRGSIPDLGYFSFHMITETCPYFAISIYK